jgi:hypothetical protein
MKIIFAVIVILAILAIVGINLIYDYNIRGILPARQEQPVHQRRVD